jgi:hypothetical protein
MRRSIPRIIILVFMSGFLFAACSPKGVHEVISPSSLEEIDGSEFKRVILTEKAAERLDIQTALVQEEVASRMQSFSSEVVSLVEVDQSDTNSLWVRVSLTEEMQQMVDRSVPIQVGPENDDDEEDMIAELDEGRVDEDEDGKFITLYYKVANPRQDISVGQRLVVKIPLNGNGENHKIIPYAAVIYGVHGETWVYTNPAHLVFIREPIVIDYIQDDWAVLSEGPEVNTAVVTVGGAELFGTETGVSK